MGGQADDLGRIHGPGEVATYLQHGLESLGGLVVGDHNNDRLARGAGDEGNVEGAGGCRQSRHTSPPRSKAEVPAYAIKSRNVLQLREDFADERENHAIIEFSSVHRPAEMDGH